MYMSKLGLWKLRHVNILQNNIKRCIMYYSTDYKILGHMHQLSEQRPNMLYIHENLQFSVNFHISFDFQHISGSAFDFSKISRHWPCFCCVKNHLLIYPLRPCQKDNNSIDAWEFWENVQLQLMMETLQIKRICVHCRNMTSALACKHECGPKTQSWSIS